MTVLDEKGRVFGFINIIDALVILAIIASVAAGTAFLFDHRSAGGSAAPVQEVTYRVNEPAYIASHLAVGLDTADGSGEIIAVDITGMYEHRGESYRTQDVTIQYHEEVTGLRIGAERTLAFSSVTVRGRVVSWHEVLRNTGGAS